MKVKLLTPENSTKKGIKAAWTKHVIPLFDKKNKLHIVDFMPDM